jgi:hypothetical protein
MSVGNQANLFYFPADLIAQVDSWRVLHDLDLDYDGWSYAHDLCHSILGLLTSHEEEDLVKAFQLGCRGLSFEEALTKYKWGYKASEEKLYNHWYLASYFEETHINLTMCVSFTLN